MYQIKMSLVAFMEGKKTFSRTLDGQSFWLINSYMYVFNIDHKWHSTVGGFVHLWPQTNFSLAYGAACNTKRYHLKKALLYHMTATREGKGYHVFPLRHMIPATCIFLNCCSYSISGGITHLEESTTSTYCT